MNGSAPSSLDLVATSSGEPPPVPPAGEKALFRARSACWPCGSDIWGYFVPRKVDSAIPWLVPPLHARFLGAVYLSGFVLLARRTSFPGAMREARVLVPLTILWTGLLFLISLFYFDQFDWGRQARSGSGSAPTSPIRLIGAWLVWRHRGDRRNARRGGSCRRLYAPISRRRASSSASVALALLIAPAGMAAIWPWKISELLAPHLFVALPVLRGVQLAARPPGDLARGTGGGPRQPSCSPGWTLAASILAPGAFFGFRIPRPGSGSHSSGP